MSDAIVAVKDVTFSYGGGPVLEGLSFSIAKGEYVGVIGPNGGGKSTLLKVIFGLLKPSSGSVELFGQSIEGFKDWTKIGYLPQRAVQFDGRFPITVMEVVSQGRVAKAGLFKRLSKVDHEAIERAMAMSDVERLKHRHIANLSGGERQRVFIARALASEPEILFLDEPAAGVDVASQGKFYRFLRELNADHGMTIVFVSHDVEIMRHEVSSLLCLNRRLICHGSPSIVFQKKKSILSNLYGENVSFMFGDDEEKSS